MELETCALAEFFCFEVQTVEFVVCTRLLVVSNEGCSLRAGVENSGQDTAVSPPLASSPHRLGGSKDDSAGRPALCPQL